MIAEPVASGGRELRRGFVLQPGTRVLVVDDVQTTGLSVRETLEALRPYQPKILGVEGMIDRSNDEASKQFDVPYRALFTVSAARSYDPTDCPQCREGLPLMKPGTRKMPGQA